MPAPERGLLAAQPVFCGWWPRKKGRQTQSLQGDSWSAGFSPTPSGCGLTHMGGQGEARAGGSHPRWPCAAPPPPVLRPPVRPHPDPLPPAPGGQLGIPIVI